MNFPVTIQFGETKIALHVVTELLGMFIGFRYFLYLRKKQGDTIESRHRIIILLGAIFGSLLGSRLVGCLEDVHQLQITDNLWNYIMSNKSIAGGLLGGLWGVEIIKLGIKEKKHSGDLFVFPLLLAMIIGRLGCFSMGVYEETYGNVTTSFFGMNLGDGLLRHPVMLYELFFLTVLWIVLQKIKTTFELQQGILFKLFMLSYLFFRLFVETLKPSAHYIAGLSTIQIACVLGLLYYAVLLLLKKLKTHAS